MEQTTLLALLKLVQARAEQTDADLSSEEPSDFGSRLLGVAGAKERFDRCLVVQKVVPHEQFVSLHLDIQRSTSFLRENKFDSAVLHVPYTSILGLVQYEIRYPAATIQYSDLIVEHALVTHFLSNEA